ncbi:uncharacterized protein [Fopius arisanus]|uniref:Uncharacterized protein isoform X2 n=1 Tax=Fopius arisanus TaxID=64838 RepID=A0A9R1TZC7_9HYME|nr:PREDICTED: uncharacterized protein LOC105266725 isoform X2 [Fopius arisanus]
MKTRKKSNSFFKAIALLMILVISLKPSSGQSSDEKYTRGNYQMTKTQTRAREVRGIRPGSLQTARDFGKRNDRLLELKDVFDRQLKRYPIHWLLELQRYPRVTRQYERALVNTEDQRNSITRLLLQSL